MLIRFCIQPLDCSNFIYNTNLRQSVCLFADFVFSFLHLCVSFFAFTLTWGMLYVKMHLYRSTCAFFLSPVFHHQYFIWNEFNPRAGSFSTVNIVCLSTTISTLYCIWNEFNPSTYSLSTTSVVPLTRSSFLYPILKIVNLFADLFFGTQLYVVFDIISMFSLPKTRNSFRKLFHLWNDVVFGSVSFGSFWILG